MVGARTAAWQLTMEVELALHSEILQIGEMKTWQLSALHSEIHTQSWNKNQNMKVVLEGGNRKSIRLSGVAHNNSRYGDSNIAESVPDSQIVELMENLWGFMFMNVRKRFGLSCIDKNLINSWYRVFTATRLLPNSSCLFLVKLGANESIVFVIISWTHVQ